MKHSSTSMLCDVEYRDSRSVPTVIRRGDMYLKSIDGTRMEWVMDSAQAKTYPHVELAAVEIGVLRKKGLTDLRTEPA